MTLMVAEQWGLVKCWIFVKPSGEEKCFISIRVNIIRCLPQNIAEMKAYVNIGMNIVILFIKKGPDLWTGDRMQVYIIIIKICLP